MNVILGTSANYLPYSAVTAASVCRHMRDGERVAFHLMHADRVGKRDIDAFKENLACYADRATFEFVAVHDTLGLAERFRTTGHIQGAATYLRLYIPELFSGRFSRALYLDSDLIACRNLGELFEIELRGKCIAGVEDMLSLSHLRSLGLPDDGGYVNAGVLLYDLERIDRERMLSRLSTLFKGGKKYAVIAGDQDILSLLFHDSILYLRPEWNVMAKNSYIGRSFTRTRCGIQNRHSPEEYSGSAADPGIIHYIGGVKPWHRTWYYDPLAPRWFDYARLTGYFGREWESLERFVRRTAALDRLGAAICRPFSFLLGRALRFGLSRIGSTRLRKLESAFAPRRLVREKNELLRANARKAASRPFDPERVPAFEYGLIAAPTAGRFDPEKDTDETGCRDFYRVFFASPFLRPTRTRKDVAGADFMIQHFFSDARNLDSQIAMLGRSLKGEAPLYFVDDGPVCGVFDHCSCRAIPLKYRRAYSFVVDDMGFLFDSTSKSRIRLLLERGEAAPDAKVRRDCGTLIDAIARNRITRYNFAVRESDSRLGAGRAVLVADQEIGDPAISRGGASGKIFDRMLRTALRENPGTAVYILRPQTMRAVKCHLDGRTGKRILHIDGDFNPHALFDMVDMAYVVNSPVGMEALLAGIRVACFAKSIYSGLGLTDDRHGERRKGSVDVETLFHATFLRQARHFSPFTYERLEFGDFLGEMLRLREDFRMWLKRRPHPICPPVRGVPEAIDCRICEGRTALTGKVASKRTKCCR